jgi:hypothetical protein
MTPKEAWAGRKLLLCDNFVLSPEGTMANHCDFDIACPALLDGTRRDQQHADLIGPKRF